MSPEIWMKRALRLAERAGNLNEVPIGAVVVYEGKIVGRGFNRRESRQSPSAHAELLAIESAAKSLGRWRLEHSELYTTLEPCLMCWGAILLARIPKVYFGAFDPKAGVCGSVLNLHEQRLFNHFPQVISGVLAEECGQKLSKFFKKLRAEKIALKKTPG